MDHQLLASLYAANDLLEDRGETNPAQLFGFIATELDYFWRRLTRMTGNVVAGDQAAAG